MGEEKTEEKKEEKKGGGEKKEDGPITVVLKVDMHCEGCARKVKKSAKDVPGVQDVKADIASNKLTVVGKVDPKMVCERVQKKSQKKVELISPLPKKDEGENKKQQQQKGEDKENNKEKKGEEKKEKEKEKPPPLITTVLKVYLHCEGCADLVKKAIVKFKGVQNAEPDLKAQKVTVKGTMDPNKLAEYVHRKTKKRVEVVPPQKEGGKKEEKKEGEKKDGGEKKEGGGDNKKKDSGEKKDGEGKKKDGGDESKGGDGGNEESKADSNKNEVPFPRYVIEYVHPPQIFSDENPNACSVM